MDAIDGGTTAPILQKKEPQMDQNDNRPNEAKAEEIQSNEAEAVSEKAAPTKEEIDWKSRYYYLAAEMENIRKRTEKEKENIVKYGAEKILTDLVDVVDNFERTIEMLRFDQEEKMKNVVVGLDMVRKLFLDSLNKQGLSQLEVLGKDFDPNFHEALGQEYAEGKRPNEIIREYQKGYVLNGRLMRAAKVAVASDKQ
jgi:molecular chaperone GrpE